MSYETLETVLNITSVRELEDLIIESVYLGLVSGKLNQAKKVFEVAEVAGRDVRRSDIDAMLNTLIGWQNKSANVMDQIHLRIVAADEDNKAAAAEKAKREKMAEEKFNLVRIALEQGDPEGYVDLSLLPCN